MPSVLPSSDLSCGFAVLDEEHALALEAIDALAVAARSGVLAATEGALEHVESVLHDHFAHEEALMNEAQYPERGRHKAAHDLFMQDFAEQRRGFEANALSPQVLQWMTVRMPEWVRFHVQVNDQPLGRYLSNRARSSVSPARAHEPATS